MTLRSHTLIPYIRDSIVGGIVVAEGQKWFKHRQIINPAFLLKHIKNMFPAISLSCSNMIEKLEPLIGSGPTEVDVWPFIDNLAGDVISRTAFGSCYEEGQVIFRIMKEQTDYAIDNILMIFLPGGRSIPTKANRRYKENENELQAILRYIIDKKKKAIKMGEDNGDDLLGTLLESNAKEIEGSGVGMSMQDVIEECKTFYNAGSETTSRLIVWTMVCLCLHPEWQIKARQEVLEVFGRRELDFESLKHLKIVTMILNEVLRLYPPTIMVTRATTKETKLGNMTMPPGLQIAIPILEVHHDREIWGEDASEFKPERFSEGVGNAIKGRGSNSFLPFVGGPRVCIGQNFAMTEAKIIYDNVADIDASKDSWNIRVKVLMRWKQTYKNNPKVVSSLDMILMDQQGTKIQATIKKNLIPDFESVIEEGSVRVISHFAVASNSGSYILVNHPFKLNFYKSTKVKISTDFDDSVDPYIFPSFNDLLMKNLDMRVAFDVVGLVVSTDAMHVTHEDGKEKRSMTLQLQDLTGKQIACALWDSYAVMLHKYISENQSNDSPVVVFLRMAKLKEWGGAPQISNCLFGSRLYINEAIGPIVSFQESLKAVNVAGESSNKTTQLIADTVVANPVDYYLRYQIINIDEIHEHKKEIGLTVIATIINIQVDEGWYYWACRPCGKGVKRNEVDVDGHPFSCERCGDVSDVLGKVRVVIRVQDSTGSSSFVLFGRLIQKLIHRSEAWLMDKIAKDQGRQIFPEELNTLLNRRFVFKIQISEFNLGSNYEAYTIHKCTDDESVVDQVFKQSPAYDQENVNDEGTPTNQSNKQKQVVDTIGDNINVVDLEAVTPATNVGKRPIEMVEDSPAYKCSSSKAHAPAQTLKIPKMEKLE